MMDWRWRKPLAIGLSLALLLPGKAAPVARAAGGPNLAVAQVAFHPSSPATLQPVTVEIVVENSGEPAGETTVALEWCCGRLERPLQALGPGESAAIVLEHALAFPQAGSYPITVTADAAQLLAEADEANNARAVTLTVSLPGDAPAAPSTTATWADQRDAGAIPTGCLDTELMRIGRREPLLLEDRCSDEWGNDKGCPVPDRDGDGIPEGPAWRSPRDLCPDGPGPAYFDGCPLADRDGDRTPDEEDACPDEPGPPAGGRKPSWRRFPARPPSLPPSTSR